MDTTQTQQTIAQGRAVLGIELGSTRIKAVLIDENHTPIASGSHDWENHLENNIWTYPLEEVWSGIQASYRALCQRVKQQYGVTITALAGIGFSAMMHGYLAFDAQGELLVPFRTWRNTMTEPAALALTQAFGFNIPQRWSIAHLYQAVLNGEAHLPQVAFLTTLAGYVHWQLTGERVLGVGDASGVFPIDSQTNTYYQGMVEQFDALVAPQDYPWRLRDILPRVLTAGQPAGTLTAAGALRLDPTGALQAGIPLCPPEGDAGTGMVATNSIGQRTGNVSAGTSIFAMIVLEKALSKVYTEIDMVTTPTGSPVAMVHCNNCSSDIDAWAGLFREFSQALGQPCTLYQALDTLYFQALQGDPDCGGLVSYNYYSGEPITQLEEGRPVFARMPDSRMSFANFARTHLNAALATLKLGMDILLEQETVHIDTLLGHGGFFKAQGVGQRLMAAALETTVSVMQTAGEGGPWGMALLAAYHVNRGDGEALESYLNNKVFAVSQGSSVAPDAADVAGFRSFMQRYTQGLAVQRAAVASLR